MTEKGMDFQLETNKLLSEVIIEKLPTSSTKSEPMKKLTPEVGIEKLNKSEPVTDQKPAEKLG